MAEQDAPERLWLVYYSNPVMIIAIAPNEDEADLAIATSREAERNNGWAPEPIQKREAVLGFNYLLYGPDGPLQL